MKREELKHDRTGIYFGHPYTCQWCGKESHAEGWWYARQKNWEEDAALLSGLTEEEYTSVLQWIAENIKPVKTLLPSRTSYGIKHILQGDSGIYVTNNQFKDAMLISGYFPVDETELNWRYCISKRSPAFKK